MKPLFENFQDSELMDLLAIQTQKLSLLLSERKVFSMEYEDCKRSIHALTEELDNRRRRTLPQYYSQNYSRKTS